MALKAADYQQMGRDTKLAFPPPMFSLEQVRPSTLKAGSWQCEAWMTGYNSKAKPSPTKPSWVDFSTLGWPSAAAEHVRKLTADFSTEKSVARSSRLYRAIVRMRKRYAPRINQTITL